MSLIHWYVVFLFLLENCPICPDTKTNPRALKCLQSALKASNKCPICQEPQGVLQGNQPRGEVTSRFERYSVPGYEGNFSGLQFESDFCESLINEATNKQTNKKRTK